jgi:hypothetical protein
MRLVGQDSSKLFLFLLLKGTKPLLIVIYVLQSQICPTREGEVAEQLEMEGKELEDPPYEESATATDGLVHRLTDQTELHKEAENGHVNYSKQEARPEDGDCARVVCQFIPVLRIVSSKGWQ